MTPISLIAAADQNRTIGDGEKMPWRISEDFRYFKAKTLGKPVIMGRKTFESIGKPLPERPNIVITRQGDWKAEGVEVAGSLEDALQKAEAHGPDEIMVIGGGQVYEQALPFATSVYLTEIQGVYNGTVTFPALDKSVWREVSRQHGSECAEAGMEYDFVVYERIDQK